MDIKKIIEVLIFASDKPILLEDIAEQVADVEYSVIRKAIEEINDELEETGRPFCIRKVAGGFTYATRKKYYALIENLYKDEKRVKLTKTALEVLAIIAYHQPVTRIKTNAIRGVDSSYHIRNLLEVNLIKIVGRMKRFGRPILYGTGDKFLKFFGLNNIEDLPNLKEIKEIIEDDVKTPQKVGKENEAENKKQ